MNCKDCLHFKACYEMATANGAEEFNTLFANQCGDFTDRSEWLHLPCKVGQTVYYIAFGKVHKGKCHAITIHKDSLQIHLYDYDGDNASISDKYVFFTREEAEKALERSKG